MSPENFFRGGFESAFKKVGRTGVRFHAFRRFREALLQKSEARQLLKVCWAPTILRLAQADWAGNFLAVHCSKLVFLVFVDSSKKNIFHTFVPSLLI